MSVIPNPTVISWIPVQGDARDRAKYWGTYEASRIYNDGDCVIGSDKILYICTKNGVTSAPTVWPKREGPQGIIGPQGLQGLGMPAPVVEGSWLKGVGGSAVWAPFTVSDIPNLNAKPTYGTDLPLAPIDGQEHILVDSFSNPTWSWHCRYNANSTNAHKWEVVGSIPIFAYVNGQVTINATGWQSISSGVWIRVPRSGVYICEASGRTMNNAGAGNYNHFNLCFSSSPANYFGPTVVHTSGNGLWGSPYITPFAMTFNVNDYIGLSTAITAPPAYYDMIVWSIKPVRIS